MDTYNSSAYNTCGKDAITPAPSPVSLSQAHAPRWIMRSANVWASRRIWNGQAVAMIVPLILSSPSSYLVRPLSINGHNKSNTTCLMLILRVVQSLSLGQLPPLRVIVSTFHFTFGKPISRIHISEWSLLEHYRTMIIII